MTLIAYFLDLGVGISDLLVTVEGPGGWPYIPSIGNAGASVLELPFHPTRLVRKIGKLTVGGQTTPFMIAGTVSHVQALLETAQNLALGKQRPEFSRVPLDRNSLGSVLDHAARFAVSCGQTHVSVIGLRRNMTAALRPLRRHLPYFGDVMLAGSGAPEMEIFLEAKAQNYEKAFATDSKDMKIYRAMHYLPMQLLSADRQVQSPTLSEGVGGFYEVLYNYRGQLHPDEMSWLRILGDLDEPLGTSLRVRALWWHSYEKNNLIVMSAPDENLEMTAGESVHLPVERLRVDCFGPYAARALKPPPAVGTLLPRLARSRFNSFSLSIPGDRRLLLSAMASRGRGFFRVKWSNQGVNITLDPNEFRHVVAEAASGRCNPF
jgi:hypothetical protein